MPSTKIFWACLLSTCLFMQCMSSPLQSMLIPAESRTEMAARQTPLAPSQFALAATRFIVMLPFLPLMMAVPGVTAVLMPLFMAMQDRLKTIIPNFPNIIGGGSNNNNQQGGSVTNSGVGTVTAEDATNDSPTFFRFKRSIFKLPTKALNEGFREVFEILHKTDDVINHLTSSQPDCRRQAVCRLHYSVDPTIGSFLGNMIQVLKLESQVEKLDVSDLTREIIKDVLKAANTGLYHQDCGSVYSRCSLARRTLF